MTPLKVSSDIIVKTIKTEPELSMAKNINQGANNLSKRIDELLDFTRSEIGTFTIRCRIISPSKLLRDVITYMVPIALKKDIKISLEISAGIPKLRADKDRLQQVLLNLLDNAIKYTLPGGMITCKAGRQGLYNKFVIRDTGLGMDNEQQKLLFHPYNRFGGKQDRVGGLGLGLVLAKKIVELHGGKISVTSKKGAGSVFTILIPHV